jgi:hypothetical protein
MAQTAAQAPHTAADGRGIVYIRPADRDNLPDAMREAECTPYAIHDMTGARLGLAPDRQQAFALARRNDLIPVSVH